MRFSKDIVAFGVAFAFILIVIFGFIGKSIFFRSEAPDPSQQTSERADTAKKYPSLPAEALRMKISKNEAVEIIDLRPPLFYTEEHIPYSKHKLLSDLGDYSPANADAEVIIVTLADDTVSMDQADARLKDKPFAYAFLEGGISSWKAINGNLISAGDPNSVVDRSKVSFKTAEETRALIDGPDKNLYTIIDTRKSSSYANGHIPTALNIPLDTLEEQKNSIPSGRQVIVYGASDLDSFQSAVRLYDMNLFSPYALENGFAAWMAQKYDVEK